MAGGGGGSAKLELLECISVELELIVPFVTVATAESVEPGVGLVTTWDFSLSPFDFFDEVLLLVFLLLLLSSLWVLLFLKSGHWYW